jgi:hypothetical protein
MNLTHGAIYVNSFHLEVCGLQGSMWCRGEVGGVWSTGGGAFCSGAPSLSTGPHRAPSARLGSRNRGGHAGRDGRLAF